MNETIEKHLLSFDELALANGVATGRAISKGGKEAKVRTYLRKLRRQALPHETITWHDAQ